MEIIIYFFDEAFFDLTTVSSSFIIALSKSFNCGLSDAVSDWKLIIESIVELLLFSVKTSDEIDETDGDIETVLDVL